MKKYKLIIFIIGFFAIPGQVTTAQSYTLVVDNFTIVAKPGDSLIVKFLAEVISTNRTRMETFFDIRLADTVLILLPGSQSAFEQITGQRLPEWSAAVAFPDLNKIVLKPGDYFNPGLYSESLLHELTHIYIHACLPDNSVPVWFNEGLAMYLSNTAISWEQSITIGNAVVAQNLLSFEDIERMIRFHKGQAGIAYIQSYLAVEYLVEQFGPHSLRDILTALKTGRNIAAAFQFALGIEYVDFEYLYVKWLKNKYWWLVFLQIKYLLWIIILGLVFLAIVIVKLRNRAVIRKWADEE